MVIHKNKGLILYSPDTQTSAHEQRLKTAQYPQSLFSLKVETLKDRRYILAGKFSDSHCHIMDTGCSSFLRRDSAIFKNPWKSNKYSMICSIQHEEYNFANFETV